VASFQFSPAELGRAHSREELEAIFQQLYGSAQGAHGKRLFAESADQLALEAAAAKAGSPARAPAAAAALTPAAAPQQGAPVSGAPPVAAAQQVALERAAQPSTQHAMDALSARLSGRMGGGEVQEGFDAPAPADRAGRKRIAPEPLGAPPAPAAAPTAAARPSSADLMPPPPPVRPPGGQQQEAKRQRPEAGPPAAGSGRAAAASGRGAPTTSAVAGGASAGVAGVAQPPVLLRRGDVPAEVTADLGPAPRLFEDPATSGASVPHRHLRVTNREWAGAAAAAAGGARQQAEVACLQGREVVWSDSLQGAAVAACGTPNFAAVGLADGQLVVGGRAWRLACVRCHSLCVGCVCGGGRDGCSAPASHAAKAAPRRPGLPRMRTDSCQRCVPGTPPAPPHAALLCGWAPPVGAPEAGRRHCSPGLRRRLAPAGPDHRRHGARV
jgi:hypothetical protein